MTSTVFQRESVQHAEVGGLELDVIETTTTLWLIDSEHRQFARLPAGTAVTSSVRYLAWTPYTNVEYDRARAAYALWLDDNGTRVVRFCVEP